MSTRSPVGPQVAHDRRTQRVRTRAMDYPAPIGDHLLEGRRCQNRGGPGGQRCQLLIDHDTCHSAAIGGTVYSWDAAGDDAELTPGPHRWAPSFPRDE